MKNKSHIIHTILFSGFLLLGGGLCLLHGTRDFSEMENRVLTAFPQVTAQGVLSKSVQRDLENAAADQITGRDFFVKLSTGLRFATGERCLGDTYIFDGDDGVRYFEKVTSSDISEKRLNTNVSVIKTLAGKNPDIKTTVFLAPTNSIVGKDMLPAGAYIYDDTDVIKKIKTTSPDTKLLYEPGQFELSDYFATDHHWNTFGAYRGTKLYLESVGKVDLLPAKDDFEFATAKKPFFGTLYSKAPLAACLGEEFVYPVSGSDVLVSVDGSERDGIYEPEYLLKKDKYATYFGGNFGRVEIVNEDASSDDTLLIVKDSFANSAIPYLMSCYKRIVMIDLRYHNASFSALISEVDPDELLFFYEMSDFFEDENFSKLLK